jgi:hypothetical protein
MSRRTALCAATAAAAAVVSLTLATAQPPPSGRPPATLDERVAALERGLASVTTRFDLRDSAAAPAGPGALEPRIANHERTIDPLSADMLRLEREADNAFREASAARREAMNAARAARDAAMRVR